VSLRSLTLDELTIDDEGAFRSIAIYRRLKEILAEARHVFRVPTSDPGWDRTLFLNLTYWSPGEETSVLREPRIAADVVAHTAWHHVVMKHLAPLAGGGAPSAEALFFGESIASAFDLYLVGRLLPLAPDCEFLETQVPVMREAAEEAGLDEAGFARLLEEVTADPERAFEDLRSLLYDAGLALTAAPDAAAAAVILDGLAPRRMTPLLHHFQMSNWILYARAYAARPERAGLAAEIAEIQALDRQLRTRTDSDGSLGWLEATWLRERSGA
jgi:hypothetical protein